MSNIIYLILGVIIGSIIVYISYHNVLKNKNDIVEDYKKGIEIHNKRELRLIFINQSIKDYVKQQLDITKKQKIKEKVNNNIVEYTAAGYYAAFKDIEKIITQLEKNSEDLITKE